MCVIDGLQEVKLNVRILPGSSQGWAANPEAQMNGRALVDVGGSFLQNICMCVELLKLIFKGAWLMKNTIFLH